MGCVLVYHYHPVLILYYPIGIEHASNDPEVRLIGRHYDLFFKELSLHCTIRHCLCASRLLQALLNAGPSNVSVRRGFFHHKGNLLACFDKKAAAFIFMAYSFLKMVYIRNDIPALIPCRLFVPVLKLFYLKRLRTALFRTVFPFLLRSKLHPVYQLRPSQSLFGRSFNEIKYGIPQRELHLGFSRMHIHIYHAGIKRQE